MPGGGRPAALRRGDGRPPGEGVSGRRAAYYDAAIQTMPLERLAAPPGRAARAPARPRLVGAGAVLPAEARSGGPPARRPPRPRRPRRHPDDGEGRAARERGGASALRRLSRRAASRRACASARRPARAGGRRSSSGRGRTSQVDYAASARGRWRWGLRPGMSLANAHPFGMNAGGWHFSHGIEALGVLNIPSGPPVGAAHVAGRRRGVAAAPARHVPALRQRRAHLRRRGARRRASIPRAT